MGEGLDERLSRWAEQTAAGPVGAVDEAALWQGGRRLRHRRRLLAGMASVLVLVAGVAGLRVAGSEPRGVDPALPGAGTLGLPDRVYPAPSRPYTLPLGEVVAVAPAWVDSGWFGTESAVIGIAARTGEYGRIPTEDDAGKGMALSPDGTRLAWWTCGTPTGGNDLAQATGECTATGIAVRNLVTGSVERAGIETRFGLDPQVLRWLDGDRLMVTAYQVSDVDQDTTGFGFDAALDTNRLWSTEEGWTTWPFPRPKDLEVLDTAGGNAYVRQDTSVRVQNPTTGVNRSTGVASPKARQEMDLYAWRPDQQAVVAVSDSPRLGEQSFGPYDGTRNWLHWASVDAKGRAENWRVLHSVTGVLSLEGWRGGAVVATTADPEGNGLQLELVNPEQDTSTPFISYVQHSSATPYQWAGDLLAGLPVRPGQEPDSRRHPAVTWGFGAGLGLAVVVGALLWRRRRV